MNGAAQRNAVIPRSAALLSFGVLLVGLTSDSAAGQSNSLRRLRRVETTTDLRQATSRDLWPGPQVRAPFVTTAEPDAPPRGANLVLRRASLISVELPEQEKIGVGDLVTIIIREDKTFRSDSRLKSDKEWKLDAELKKWFRFDGLTHLLTQDFAGGTPGAELDFSSEYQGRGKVDRKDSLVTRIQAKVIDVKPNGNLVLEARKRITVDEEDQIATLSGICRSKDVTAQNTVLSTQVADLEIGITHTGAARDAARRGWAMRLFDLLRPF